MEKADSRNNRTFGNPQGENARARCMGDQRAVEAILKPTARGEEKNPIFELDCASSTLPSLSQPCACIDSSPPEGDRLMIHVVPRIFVFSDRPIVLVVFIVLLVPTIPIVLIVYLVFEVSIVAGVGVTRVVLLFPLIAIDAVTFHVGYLSFEPRRILRHAVYWKSERPGHNGHRHYC